MAWISASPLSEANLPSACTAAGDKVRRLRTSGWGRFTGAMRISMRSIPKSPSSLNDSSNCGEIIRMRVANVALEQARIRQLSLNSATWQWHDKLGSSMDASI